VSEHYNLLIDLGNTSIKTCLYRGSQGIDSTLDIQIFENAKLMIAYFQEHSWRQVDELLPAVTVSSYRISKVVVSNVNNARVEQQIKRLGQVLSADVMFTQTQASLFGLQNSYKTPTNMGVDRWIAMLACKHLCNDDFIVFDLGTAITTDAVVNNVHIGGWIAPGYMTLKSSLLQNTTRVFADNFQLTQKTDFGTDTPECVERGILSQIQGGFELAVKNMQKYSNNFKIFVTGGDKSKINLSQFNNASYSDNLVLRGLTLFVD